MATGVASHRTEGGRGQQHGRDKASGGLRGHDPPATTALPEVLTETELGVPRAEAATADPLANRNVVMGPGLDALTVLQGRPSKPQAPKDTKAPSGVTVRMGVGEGVVVDWGRVGRKAEHSACVCECECVCVCRCLLQRVLRPEQKTGSNGRPGPDFTTRYTAIRRQGGGTRT